MQNGVLLEELGVTELKSLELCDINGGNRIKTIFRFLETVGVVDAVKEFAEGFSEGYKEARE